MSADPTDSPAPLAEISQGPSAFEMFLDRNQKNLIALAIALAVGTAGYVVYDGIKKGAQTTAGNALFAAGDTAALQKITAEHATSLAAGTAAALLAERQWTDGQKDAAIETLRSLLASKPDHPAIPSARASLGAKLMAQGKSGDAVKVFNDLVADPKSDFLAPYALTCLGDIALAAGDTDQASKFYEQVKIKHASSDFAKSVTDRQASLKAKPPVEIEPPPAPPAPANTPDGVAPAISTPTTAPQP